MDDRSVQEQDRLDQAMHDAISEAHRSAGVMIAVGKQLVDDSRELVAKIQPKVHEAIPMAIGRVKFSYSLLIFATLKVSLVACWLKNSC